MATGGIAIKCDAEMSRTEAAGDDGMWGGVGIGFGSFNMRAPRSVRWPPLFIKRLATVLDT